MTGDSAALGEICRNCQAQLSGSYCSNCGQKHEPHVHSVVEFTHEAIEGITHADSRLWRTLWLLIASPGELTREFIEGRRARYLPPFRLYLVLSVLMFLVIAAVTPHSMELSPPPASAQQGERERVPANETPDQRAKRVCDSTRFGIGPKSLEPRMKRGCQKILSDDGHAFGQALLHNIPRALFVLIPLLALVMSALYWRRYYVEHLLFFIHTHAFTFVLYSVMLIALALSTSGWLNAAWVLIMLIYPAIYTYKAMRNVYGQARWLRRLKFLALTLAYGALFVTMAWFTALYSMVTL